jgi:nucleotide-binding universal stress UspA family protein
LIFKKILVAVDGSECANQAVWVAAYFAVVLGADLCVISAFDPVPAKDNNITVT